MSLMPEKYEKRIDQIIKTIEVVGGTAFGVYSSYLAIKTGNLFYMGSFTCAFFMAFNKLDRDVYFERYINLTDLINEADLDVNIERVSYTDYEIVDEE